MNLLMISGDRSLAEGKRGAFWYTLQELSKHFDTIDIICPYAKAQKHSGKPVHVFEQSGTQCAVRCHPCPKPLWYQPWWILRKGKEIYNTQPYAVMTVHSFPPFYNDIGALLLSRATGVPTLSEIHHITGYPYPANLQERIGYYMSRWGYPFLLRWMNGIRTVNSHVTNTLVQWGIPKQKIHMAPSFYLQSNLLKKEYDGQQKYDVAFCARLVENKGLFEFIDAVAMLDDVTAVIVGDGPLRAAAEQRVAEQGLQNRVTCTGWLNTHEDVLDTMKSAKIFTMNSKSEGGPRVLLEAMGSGVATIATAVGVVPDVLVDGHNGILTTGTAQDLAQKIQLLLSDDTKRASIANESKKIADAYDRSELVAGMPNAYKNMHAFR